MPLSARATQDGSTPGQESRHAAPRGTVLGAAREIPVGGGTIFTAARVVVTQPARRGRQLADRRTAVGPVRVGVTVTAQRRPQRDRRRLDRAGGPGRPGLGAGIGIVIGAGPRLSLESA